MDENFRIAGKVSLMDIIFIIMALAAIVLLRRFAAPKTAEAAGGVPIRYTVELNRREEGYGKNIKVGETLYDSEKGYEIGKITDVYEKPFWDSVPDVSGKVYRKAYAEGLVNVYVVAEAQAQISERSTSVGQYDLLIGKTIFVKSPSFSAGGYVVEIDRTER
ncbi:MAG: DUF4330 domain-containing protein [Clostridiales bacterium]|jgi:hypothetical protein|nr:DUF4330 domain-containing protein [Clostridiales bacterium]